MFSTFKESIPYKFWFYGWLFKDASKGTLWERSAAIRHNRANAHWLLLYMRRWLFMMATFFAVAVVCEVILGHPGISAFFYVPSILTIPYNVVTVVAWFFLKSSGPGGAV